MALPSVRNLLGLRGCGLEAMIALMSFNPELDVRAPLTTYASSTKCNVWAYRRATFVLQASVQKQGLQPLEHVLYLGRVGGAARLAAAVLQPAVIQREERWCGGAFMEYIRDNLEDSRAVSRAFFADVMVGGIQPGQGTQWGNESDRLLIWGNRAWYILG